MNIGTDKIVEMCRNLILTPGKISDEYLFTLNAVDLFFYKRNIGQVDIKTGFTDGTNDGGIDFIYSDTDTMYLIQGKSTENMSVEDIKNVFYKIIETVIKFDNKNYSHYSNILKTAYINTYEDLSDDKNIELVLFTNTIISDDMRMKLLDFSKLETISDYEISIYDAEDIKLKDAIIAQDSDLIEEDSIEIELNKNNLGNMLLYEENGLIVNIKAASLKRLYEKYGTKGLFSFNLREHISQKNVDDAIDETIKKDKDRFWFYNNGITIGCKDFYKDGNKIKLYGFSIINGAQTTTKIGKSKLVSDDYDFSLVCKIVKAEDSNEIDSNFIGKISEASNSQKPIKQRDLKSNAKEQKLLQNGSYQNGKLSLAIEIKRGVKPKNYKKVEKWQRVTNEYVGQLILSCILQRPGLARNSKHIMFSSEKLYNQIFKRKHDYNTLFDLVRIGHVYDEFLTDYTAKTNDIELITVANNGKLPVLALIIYLYKKHKGFVKDYASDQLHKDNIKGLLVTDYTGNDLDENLIFLFVYVIKKLRDLYETKKESMKLTSYSNFFKSETTYEVILKSFDEIDEWDRQKLGDFMVVFTDKKS